MNIDTNYFKQLFYDLNELSKQLKYIENIDLVYFHHYTAFIKWLAFNHKDIFLKDDRYFWLDDVENNLKEFAIAYLNYTNTKSVYDKNEDDIPHVHALVSDMMFDLRDIEVIKVDRIIDPTQGLSDIKEILESFSKEFNKDTSRAKKIAREIVKELYSPAERTGAN